MLVMVLSLAGVSAESSAESGRLDAAKALYAATGALAPAGSGDKAITRGEFITSVISSLKIDLTKENVRQFYMDVSANTSTGKALEYALALDLASPSENFYPDNSITYKEAAKILVTALGYGEEAVRKGGYPSGYMLLAAREGLAKHVSLSADSTITAADFYIIMRSFLEADLRLTERFTLEGGRLVGEYSDGGNVLEQLYGWESFTGIINGDEKTALFDNTLAYKNGLLIGDRFYECGKEYTLGTKVTGYSSDESGNDAVVFMEESKSNEKIFIPAADLTDISKNEVRCTDENGNEKTYSLEGLHSVIYNGKACFDDISGIYGSMKTGSVTLVDNDSDGAYEVVLVMDGGIMSVGNVNDNKKCIYDTISGKSIDFSDGTIIRAYQNGARAYINSIKKGSVVEYYQSADKKYTEIYILTDALTGVVTGKGDDCIYVDDKEYKFSDYFKSYNLKSINTGDENSFILAADGSIACVSEFKEATAILAYMSGIDMAEKLGRTMKIRLYNEAGEFLTLETADTVRINGERAKTIKEAYNSLSATGEQPIKYSLNASGKISNIYTENSYGEYDPAVDSVNGLKRYNFKQYNTDTKIYYKRTGYFIPHFTIDTETKIIVVDDAAAARTEKERFSIGSLTTWINDAFIESNRLLVYNVSEAGAAPILFYKKNSINEAVSLNSTKFGFIAKVTDSLDLSGDKAYKITLCNNNTYSSFYVPTDSTLAGKFTDKTTGEFTLGIGDHIRYIEGNNSRLEAIALDYDYDPNPDPVKKPLMVLTAARENYPVNFYYGTIRAFTSSSMSIDLIDSSTGEKGYPVAFIFKKAYVWIFNTKTQTIETARPDTMVSAKQSAADADKIVVRALAGEVKDVMIIR